MFGWLRRPVKSNQMLRNEIACSMRAVRSACNGRACMRQCLRRIAGAAPLRRGTSRGGAALACAALLLATGAASAEVECVWMGNGYSCSGSGDTIHVIGGLPGGEGGGGSVVTNMIGTCTNCVAMSPEYVRNLKDSAIADLEECNSQNYVVGYEAQSIIASAHFYTNIYPVSGLSYIGSSTATRPQDRVILDFVTNNLSPSFKPVQVATAVTSVSYDQVIVSSRPQSYPVNWRQNFIASYDAAASAYNDAASFANSAVYHANEIYNASTNMQLRLDSLSSTINQLSDEQCTAQWDGGTGLPGDGEGGGNVVTNQASGDWCTYDQGEALKELLRDIKTFNERQLLQLRAISNSVASIDENIQRALFTSYTHIPTEEELGTTWQDLYLSGYNPNFHAYQSTNILARIELLVAGISGVLTNSNAYAEADELADDVKDTTDELQDTFDSVKSGFADAVDQQTQKSQSIGAALIRLYQKFRQWTGVPFSTEGVIASYSIDSIGNVGSPEIIPAMAMRQQDVSWANMVRVVVRSLMSVVYIFLTIAVFVRFHIAFFEWCWKYVKWAIEVMQGFFA